MTSDHTLVGGNRFGSPGLGERTAVKREAGGASSGLRRPKHGGGRAGNSGDLEYSPLTSTFIGPYA